LKNARDAVNRSGSSARRARPDPLVFAATGGLG